MTKYYQRHQRWRKIMPAIKSICLRYIGKDVFVKILKTKLKKDGSPTKKFNPRERYTLAQVTYLLKFLKQEKKLDLFLKSFVSIDLILAIGKQKLQTAMDNIDNLMTLQEDIQNILVEIYDRRRLDDIINQLFPRRENYYDASVFLFQNRARSPLLNNEETEDCTS